MRKAVLMSMQPKWCELIASGKKTVEVRKSRPKIETPFNVYIYETQGRKYSFGVKADTIAKHDDDRFLDCARGNPPIKEDENGTPYFSYGRMKVIGEFVCDEIQTIHKDDFSAYGIYDCSDDDVIASCMQEGLLWDYGQGKDVYFWHISDLVIYDKPKELSEFYRKCDEGCEACAFWKKMRVNKDEYDMDCASPVCEHIPITRPPQSWCYVEELEDI